MSYGLGFRVLGKGPVQKDRVAFQALGGCMGLIRVQGLPKVGRDSMGTGTMWGLLCRKLPLRL